MTGILWIASYPKSGNTWLRILIENALRESTEPIDINRLKSSQFGADRLAFDEAVGIEASDLTQCEIEIYRTEAYKWMSRNAHHSLYLKVHDSFLRGCDDKPLFPPEASAGAIYILRNPLDVAASYAHHSGQTIDMVIETMNDENAQIGSRPERFSDQLPQRLTSWSSHALGWIDQSSMPVHFLRYEDLLKHPLETFSQAAQFAGIQLSPEKLSSAVNDSSFSRVSELERANGFSERYLDGTTFFRRGQVGSWREKLSASQVEALVSAHNPLMQRFGYVSKSGELLV